MYSKVALMNALMVQVEGMKAENAQRGVEGHSPAYVENDFLLIVAQLEELSVEFVNM